MKESGFIAIARNNFLSEEREKYMVEPQPIPYEKKVCALQKAAGAPVRTQEKMKTKEELYEALDVLRKQYEPFLLNHAPKLEEFNRHISIETFTLDGEKEITIPHFGGPLGYAKQVYEAEFSLENFQGKAVYFGCKGADYKATVYINDVCIGIHEGFFSPFEFEITQAAHAGKNRLKIVLENDFVYMGNTRRGEAGVVAGGEKYQGDKLYAATGVGYDDPEIGWHHCPPGFGIYHEVYIEVRNMIHISDMYVRPDVDAGVAELWLEIENAEYEGREVVFDLSLYGQNFEETIFEHLLYEPKIENKWMLARRGKNIYKIPISISDIKVWEPDTPFLYQLQVSVTCGGKLCDKDKYSFGMRSFVQDNESHPKGRYYLNGRSIRLRGANTMGFEQQDVMRGDFKQLIDDILLAKVCHMNFWRLTQRPVQDEVYQYCDMLGLMTQTDLPLFSVMRRNKVCEALRQTEEMIRMVRKHPCNVSISYINEPHFNEDHLDNGKGRAEPHRHLVREELESFFLTCDSVVKLNQPDCVIKHIDGDFMSPDLSGSNCMPDNHCYTMWYFGHGIDIGKLHKGYWQRILPDWYYGCGEYGGEGLDFPDLMRRRYPKEWLKEPFDPDNIVCAQTKTVHFMFFDTPTTLEGWVDATHRHQVFSTKMMTEAFRRDPRMVSFAIHLFIDAWPSGWMKTIMDCERTPKPAFFAYRDALEPIMVSLRSDRFTYYEDETVSVEAYVCNDTQETDDGDYRLVFELYDSETLIMQKEQMAEFEKDTTSYIANAEFRVDAGGDRKKYTLKAVLLKDGEVCHYNTFDFEVFARQPFTENNNIVLISDLDVGEHEIAGEIVKVKDGERRVFVSRNTGHPAVDGFREHDFFMWYDKKEDMITPILRNVFEAEGFTPILLAEGNGSKVMAAGVKEYQGKKYVISMLDLRHEENPIAQRFLKKLYEM
ncbi:MAG: glycoside hydrolase family 2 [Clostridia bacterium]|nr:glycoside hydrolase family 2 [Clostridia bacterium]